MAFISAQIFPPEAYSLCAITRGNVVACHISKHRRRTGALDGALGGTTVGGTR